MLFRSSALATFFGHMCGPIQEPWQHSSGKLPGPIQECWQYCLGSCMGPHNILSSTLQAVPGPIQEGWHYFLGSCMGPHNIIGSTLQAAPWAHPGVLACWAAAWAHTVTFTALFRQLPGPIQECWQNFLGSCMGPHNHLSGTVQAALWAHPVVLEAFFRQLHGPTQPP